MGRLRRKLSGSTLMETMVSTVLLVVIFMVSSMILSNLFQNQLQIEKQQVQHRMEVLAYQYRNDQLHPAHSEEINDWRIWVDTKSTIPLLLAKSSKSEEQMSIELQ